MASRLSCFRCFGAKPLKIFLRVALLLRRHLSPLQRILHVDCFAVMVLGELGSQRVVVAIVQVHVAWLGVSLKRTQRDAHAVYGSKSNGHASLLAAVVRP